VASSDCARRPPESELALGSAGLLNLNVPSTVGVAQLVERWIVVPVAVGSNPTTHPNEVSYFVQVLKPQSRAL
jgi:hypothetical protein